MRGQLNGPHQAGVRAVRHEEARPGAFAGRPHLKRKVLSGIVSTGVKTGLTAAMAMGGRPGPDGLWEWFQRVVLVVPVIYCATLPA
ncbi:hypothetical protein ACIQNV_36655 [Streptomyces hydrogenans]|uniref:hypothetical protein n=1 Tax=Streptomyces hydrogenans TaxID=1873719 RepID=UPI0037F3B5B7